MSFEMPKVHYLYTSEMLGCLEYLCLDVNEFHYGRNDGLLYPADLVDSFKLSKSSEMP